MNHSISGQSTIGQSKVSIGEYQITDELIDFYLNKTVNTEFNKWRKDRIESVGVHYKITDDMFEYIFEIGRAVLSVPEEKFEYIDYDLTNYMRYFFIRSIFRNRHRFAQFLPQVHIMRMRQELWDSMGLSKKYIPPPYKIGIEIHKQGNMIEIRQERHSREGTQIFPRDYEMTDNLRNLFCGDGKLVNIRETGIDPDWTMLEIEDLKYKITEDMLQYVFEIAKAVLSVPGEKWVVRDEDLSYAMKELLYEGAKYGYPIEIALFMMEDSLISKYGPLLLSQQFIKNNMSIRNNPDHRLFEEFGMGISVGELEEVFFVLMIWGIMEPTNGDYYNPEGYEFNSNLIIRGEKIYRRGIYRGWSQQSDDKRVMLDISEIEESKERLKEHFGVGDRYRTLEEIYERTDQYIVEYKMIQYVFQIAKAVLPVPEEKFEVTDEDLKPIMDYYLNLGFTDKDNKPFGKISTVQDNITRMRQELWDLMGLSKQYNPPPYKKGIEVHKQSNMIKIRQERQSREGTKIFPKDYEMTNNLRGLVSGDGQLLMIGELDGNLNWVSQSSIDMKNLECIVSEKMIQYTFGIAKAVLSVPGEKWVVRDEDFSYTMKEILYEGANRSIDLVYCLIQNLQTYTNQYYFPGSRYPNSV